MGLDKKLKDAIFALVRSAIQNVMEAENEKWLSGEQLTEQFACFSKNWLKAYGHLLPRTQVVVTDENGGQVRSHWCYPLHKIQRMVQDGSIKNLQVSALK